MNYRHSEEMSHAALDSSRVIDMMKEFQTFLGGASTKYARTQTAAKESNFSPAKPDSKSLAFNSPNSQLKRTVGQREAEIHHLQAIIEKMKAESRTEEPATKKACIELEKTAESNKLLYEKEKDKNFKLSQQLQLMEKENRSLHASLSATISQSKALNEQLEKKLSASYKRIDLLQLEVEELKVENSDAVKQLKFEVNRLKGELEMAQDKINQSREHMKDVTRQLEEKSTMEKNQLQLEKDTKIRELEHQLSTMDEDVVIAHSMKGELTRLRKMENEFNSIQQQNRALVKRQENMRLLKESVATLEAELANERKRSDKVIELSLENEILKERLADWEALGSVQGENRSPTNISQYLSRLQKNEALLQEENCQLRAELHSLQTTTDQLRTESDRTKADNDKLRQTFASNTSFTRKLQRRLLLLSKECESYKKVINAYEDEVTLNITAVTRERVEMLENLVEKYKTTLNQLCSESPTADREIALRLEVDNLKKTVTQLQEELQRRQVEEKSIEDLDKIFHLRMNPTEVALQDRVAKMQRLQEENEQLKVRVQVLEERGSADVTAEMQQRLQQEGKPSNLEDLRQRLDKAKLTNKRFLEAFKRTSREFREVCYMLTGYKIDNPCQNKYKLSHMYAESPDDFLLFEQSSDGQIHMLETSYSNTLTNLMQLHLMNQNSTPAFLSALTLELFNNQTCMLSHQSLQ